MAIAEADSGGRGRDNLGYVEFEFDLPSALLTRLVEVFVEFDSVPLIIANVAKIPEEQGIYQLFLDGALVYVGKTDADAGLRKRLIRHSQKILHRHNLVPKRVTFKAVRVFVFTAMDLESDLIRHYGGVSALSWNGSGFGSNDPGRERDTTAVKDSNYDALFPIDIDREIDFDVLEGEVVSEVITRLKREVPYLLRFENSGGRSRSPHEDLESARLTAKVGPLSVREIVEFAFASLPAGWRATALPGYIIMYKNDHRNFPSGSVIAECT